MATSTDLGVRWAELSVLLRRKQAVAAAALAKLLDADMSALSGSGNGCSPEDLLAREIALAEYVSTQDDERMLKDEINEHFGTKHPTSALR